jgi:hypothetical protein
MDELFRLSGASPHDPAVAAWFAEDDPLRALAERWFVLLRGAGTDTTETLHDSCPTACVGDVAFAYVAAYSTHAAIGFFYGTSLPDPQRLLEGSGKRMRHVKLRWDRQPEPAALEALVTAAYLDIRARLPGSA